MFRPDQIGKVNANRVGEYEPGHLLIHDAQTALVGERDWNKVRWIDGEYYRVANAAGEPLFYETLVSLADLADVDVVDPSGEWKQWEFDCDSHVVVVDERGYSHITGDETFRMEFPEGHHLHRMERGT